MLGQGSYTRTEGSAAGSVHPRFYIEPVKDELASARSGRPIFKDREMVEILMPGVAAYTVPVMAVNDEHRQRWPREYEGFRAGLEISPDGTPLEEWPRLTRGQVLELKALQFRTVEDVAAMTDTAMQRVGMGGHQLRQAAAAFLDDAVAGALTAELQSKIDMVESENAALKQQVSELDRMMREMHAHQIRQANTPHPDTTAIPGMADPMEAARMAEAGLNPRDAPQSSLANFAASERHRREPKTKAA